MQTGDGLLVRLNPVTGGLSPAQLIGLCEAASRHGNGIVEITVRGSLQIRGLTLGSAGRLSRDVDALGIAVRTGVPVQTGVLAGLDPDEIADPTTLAESIRQGIAAAGLRLGPKVSVVVDGGGLSMLDEVSADVRLTAVRGDQGIAWRVAVAGDWRSARAFGTVSEANACGIAFTILQMIASLGPDARGRDLTTAHLNAILPKVFAFNKTPLCPTGHLPPQGERLAASQLVIG